MVSSSEQRTRSDEDPKTSEPPVSHEAVRVRGEQCADTLSDSLTHSPTGERLDLVMFRQGLNAGFVSLVDSSGEHGLRLALLQGRCGAVEELLRRG